MYSLGQPTVNLDYTQQIAGLPSQLYIETPASWSLVSDAISALFPGLGATGCLKSATTFVGGTGTGAGGAGGAANYVAFKTSDGNDGNSHWSGQFHCDASANPLANEYYLHLYIEDGFQPVATAGTGVNYGSKLQISPIYKQAQGLGNTCNITVSSTPLIYLPTNFPAFNFYGLYTDRIYEVHILTYGNTVRVGIKDIHPSGPGATSNSDGPAINAFLSTQGDPLNTGDEIVKTWRYGAGSTYPLNYHTTFHSVLEFQSHNLFTPKRIGFCPEQYHNAVWRIGNMSSVPYVDFSFPKHIAPPDSSLLVSGSVPTNAYQGPLGDPITIIDNSSSSHRLYCKVPVGFQGTASYQLTKSTTPGGTFTNVTGGSGTCLPTDVSFNIDSTGLAGFTTTPCYYDLQFTATDLLGTRRVLHYPQVASLTPTSNRAATTFHINNTVVTSGDGSLANPFKTCADYRAAAIGHVKGDQVMLESGISFAPYDGPLTAQNIVGVPASPVIFTSSDPAHPAVVQNFGGQYTSGNGAQAIDCAWTQFIAIDFKGPGIQQLPGSGVNFEANGTTVVGAGVTATRTSTAGAGIAFLGTQATWCPNNRTGQVFQQPTHISIPPYFEVDIDHLSQTGFHGEDAYWHYSPGNMAKSCRVYGFHVGIQAYAPGTHEDVIPTTNSGSTHILPYQIRNRQGQSLLVIQDCLTKDCCHTGIEIHSEMMHSDPAFPQGASGRVAIDPRNDPKVYDATDLTGADPFMTALLGRGTLIRSRFCNAGPSSAYNGTTNVQTLQSLDDHPMHSERHRSVVILNPQVNNIPGDCFYGDAALGLYNAGAGIGAGQYQGYPGGQSGFGINVFCTSGVLIAGGGYTCNNGRNDRGSAGPIGDLFQNVQYVWFENHFIHDAKGPADGGGVDWDGRCYYGVFKGLIGCNNSSGFIELTDYGPVTNAHCNLTIIGCASLDYQGGGAWISALATAGHRIAVLNNFGHDDSANRQILSPGAMQFVNNIWTGNNASAVDTPGFDNSQHLHRMDGGFKWNYGAGGIPLSNIDQTGVSTSDPGLPNDTPGGHFNPTYPQLVVNTNGAVAPDLTNYSYAFAKTFTNWIPSVAFGAGIDPATVGVRYPAAARTDITGTTLAIGFNPIGPYGAGTIASYHKSLLLIGVG